MKVVQFGDQRPVIIKRILDLLTRARLDLSDEKRAQRDLAELLEGAGFEFQREVKLEKTDIVDFMVSDVAIELKLKKGASKMEVYRQIERYAGSPKVGAIILATNISMGFPEFVAKKPMYFVSLGRAWL